MIESKDLRIGNWVNENVLGNCKVVGVDTSASWLKKIDLKNGHRNYSINFENLNPIPLTTDILLKCGFIKTYFGNSYKMDYTDFPWVEDNNDGTFSLIVGDPEYSISIFQYVHQLQNLFYAILNKELSITL